MGDIVGAALSIGIFAAISFGVLATLPRSRRSLLIAAAILCSIFAALTALGSGLVGPFDMRPMLLWLPLIALVEVIWFYWKVRPTERR